MNKCPQCGQRRQADEYRCLACGCFFSQLDEILAAEEEEKQRKSFKGRLKAIKNSEDSWQALSNEFRSVRENTPRRTFLVMLVIFAFVFALMVSVV